ncbi:hypothetical protein [Agrobacterium larrymoorei]|uniref:hypothetical protein n=1 Tax=Agrobacterium larrymoorei TaxID=160699 RepID=UPI0030BCBFE9
MHIIYSHINQAGGTPKATRFNEKLALLGAVQVIQSAVEDLEEGRAVKAASDLDRLANGILDEARAELADLRSLGALPPPHEINGVLHSRRRTILEKRARTERWAFQWNGDAFEVADAEANYWLSVDPSDNWMASTSGSPDWLVSDSGLLSLLAHWNGTTISEEVSRCAAWMVKGGRK